MTGRPGCTLRARAMDATAGEAIPAGRLHAEHPARDDTRSLDWPCELAKREATGACARTVGGPPRDRIPCVEDARDRGVGLAVRAHRVDDLARRAIVQLAPAELRAIGGEARIAAPAQTPDDPRDRVAHRARRPRDAQPERRARLVGRERAAHAREAPRHEPAIQQDRSDEQPADQPHPTSHPSIADSRSTARSHGRSQPPMSHHVVLHVGRRSHARCAGVRTSVSRSTR